MATKYEFRFVDVAETDWQDKMNQLGTEGFCIVASIGGVGLSARTATGWLILQRPC